MLDSDDRACATHPANYDLDTKMAKPESYKAALEKGSFCQVQIEDITNNVLLVVLKNGSVTYRGVLLDQSGSVPYCLNRLGMREKDENEENVDGMTSGMTDRGHLTNKQVEDSSLSLRLTYQDQIPQETSTVVSSPVRAINRTLKDKNIRKRMLRPRHILCSKCKAHCNNKEPTPDVELKTNLVKRRSNENDSKNTEIVPKKFKKDINVTAVETIQGNRPVIKISFAGSKENGAKDGLSPSNHVGALESNTSTPEKEKVSTDSVLAHSPSVLLKRIDWNKTMEKPRCVLDDLPETENNNMPKEHRHKHKKKHKKHKHKVSGSEHAHRHKHKKKSAKSSEGSPLEHSKSCLKIKTKVSTSTKPCVDIASLDKGEDSSSHSIENYMLDTADDRLSPPLTDGYSDSDSTDYDFPQIGLHGGVPQVDRPLMMRIQTRDVFKCVIPDGRTITVGDIVWGKIHGFPAWPGRVISIAVRQMDNGIPISKIAHVSWFGSRTRSHMPLSDLNPFIDDYQLKFNKKKKGPYKIAVKQAIVAAQQSLPDFDIDFEG